MMIVIWRSERLKKKIDEFSDFLFYDVIEKRKSMNKKPRGFMHSCFPMSVYFKCLRVFLLYFL